MDEAVNSMAGIAGAGRCDPGLNDPPQRGGLPLKFLRFYNIAVFLITWYRYRDRYRGEWF
jgi:hypothetical protein